MSHTPRTLLGMRPLNKTTSASTPACRWHAAVTAAARRVWASCGGTPWNGWKAARAEQAYLHSGGGSQGLALHRTARRMRQIEHLRTALARELQP